ncbi:MAG: NifU family protein [Mycolicibacterium sp.]|uniref:NifU family protein n=1 Tax=Mycolicibacterium sp. TaxID=2320850 RepID=UPI003D0EF340
MTPSGSSHQDASASDAQWRSAGDRIQALLDASASGGTVARERAERLVREVTDLYGAGLERLMRLAARSAPEVVDALLADDLVASLLLIHGLHPHSVQRRITDALDTVRPYLGSHGGDVHLLDVVGGPENRIARLQFSGSCKSCPSSAVTLELTVEDAVRAAAPEISSIEVVVPQQESSPTTIPAESLWSHLHTGPHAPGRWHPVPALAALTPGEVGGFQVAGVAVFACRIGDDLYAYLDRCGCCGESLAGAVLHRRMATADAVLRCPRCHAHFDVVHAGASIDGATVNSSANSAHLDPIPVLMRDGVLAMALPRPVTESVA